MGSRGEGESWGWDGLSWGIFVWGHSPSPRHCLSLFPLSSCGVLVGTGSLQRLLEKKSQCLSVPEPPLLGTEPLAPQNPTAGQAGTWGRLGVGRAVPGRLDSSSGP